MVVINQAVIVCGGLGTRLGNITKKTPKPLIKIKGITIIEYIIKYLSRFGIKEILLLCGYKGSQFKKKFHNKSKYGIKIRCIIEKNPLGTSGALLNAKNNVDKFFLYCNGDTFFNINISDLIKQFSENHCLGTIALKKMKKNSRYDSFKLNSKKLIIFNVKNKTKNINSGICTTKYNQKLHGHEKLTKK